MKKPKSGFAAMQTRASAMNLVFQALVIFAFALPGILFSSAYNIGRGWSYPVGRLGPFTERVPRTLIHAAWLNCLWAWGFALCHLAFPKLVWSIDLQSVVCWLSNTFGNNQIDFDRAIISLAASPFRVFVYFAVLYSISWMLGFASHNFIRWLKWDRKIQILRFDNAWYYLLKAEVLDFKDQAYTTSSGDRPALAAKNRVATIITAGVEIGSLSYLYIGVLVDFFNADGNLDRLLLEGVSAQAVVRRRSRSRRIEIPLLRGAFLRYQGSILCLANVGDQDS